MKKTATVQRFIGIVAVALICQLSSVTAGTMGDDITINGFGHQSAIKSDTNMYIVHNSTEGSFHDYVLGVTLGAQVNDRVTVQAQILNTQSGFGIDWGFGDYSFSESAGFRFGRVKLPLGLYTEIADVKSLQPFSYLPTLIYDHGMTSYNGIGFYGSADFQNDWAGELELFGGGSEMKSLRHAEPVAMHNFVGGRLGLTTPISGSRIMFSYMRSDLKMTMDMGMGMITEMDVESKVLLISAELIGDKYFVRSEAGSFKNTEDNITWYGEAGFLVNENLQPVVRYVHQRKENTPALTLATRAAIGQTDTQNEIAVGINYFLTNAIVMKVEHHWIDGSAQLDREVFSNDAPQKSWNLTAASVAFTF